MPTRSKLKGAFIEDLGFYNPHTKAFSANKERVTYWLGVGAKASDTLHNLFVGNKVIQGKKIPSHTHKIPEKVVPAPEAPAAPAVEAPVAEVPAAE